MVNARDPVGVLEFPDNCAPDCGARWCIEVCDYSHQCDGDDLNPAPAPTDEELHHEIATVCEQQPGTSWQSVADAVCWIGRDQPGWFYARRRIFRIVHQMASAGQLTLVRTKEQMTLSPAAAPA